MGLTTEFLGAVALLAKRPASPLLVPWPMPGNLGGVLEFATFGEWRDFMQRFDLRDGIPDIGKRPVSLSITHNLRRL